MRPDSRAVRIAVALALPCVTLIAAHVLVDPLYRTNDDPGMLLLAAGHVYVDEPTPYLAFSSHLWGRLLASLYGAMPDAPWYRLLQMFVQFAAGATLVYTTLGSRCTLSRLLPIAPILVVFDLLWWSQPHFTLTAAAAAIAATTVAGRRIVRGHRLHAGAWVGFVLLWVVAAAIRHQSAVLIYALSAPVLAGPFWRACREAGVALALRRFVPPIAVASVVIVTLYGYNSWRYDVPEWRDYIETGPTIGAVLDYSATGGAASETWEQFPDGTIRLADVEYSEKVYAAAADGPGWTRSELRMLMAWFFTDRETFSLAAVESFLQEVGEPARRRSAWLGPLRSDPNLPLMLLVLVFAVSCRRFDRFDVLGAALALAIALTALTFVDMELNRLVSWVYEPVLALLAWVAVTLGRDRRMVPAARLGFVARIAGLGLILFLLVGAAARLVEASDRFRPIHDGLGEAVTQLDPDPETLYVSWGSAFPLEFVGPFDDLAPYRNLRFYSVGGDTRGGHNLARLEQFGIDDIHAAMYLDPRLRVISEPRHNNVFIDFVQERFGDRIASKLVERFDAAGRPLFDVYRFSATSAPE